jgi:hypothetical protein
MSIHHLAIRRVRRNRQAVRQRRQRHDRGTVSHTRLPRRIRHPRLVWPHLVAPRLRWTAKVLKQQIPQRSLRHRPPGVGEDQIPQSARRTKDDQLGGIAAVAAYARRQQRTRTFTRDIADEVLKELSRQRSRTGFQAEIISRNCCNFNLDGIRNIPPLLRPRVRLILNR